MSIEPGIAIFLKPGETPHPTLSPDSLTVHWTGRLRILRADRYVFSAKVQGRFKLQIMGKEVLDQPPLAFVPGSYPLVAEFVREPGQPAQVQVFWHAKHFAQEPIPLDFLGHQADQLPERWHGWQKIERGCRLVEEYGCTNCHKPEAVAKAAEVRQGPDLTRVGERLKPDWIYAWLKNPKQLRSMPSCHAP